MPVFANKLPLLLSARYLVLRSVRRAPTTIRAIVVRLERGFAAFAAIPYQDARAQQELSRLLDE